MMTIVQLPTRIPESIPLAQHGAENVLVMGVGESGQAMARWIHAQGGTVVMHDTRSASAIPEKLHQQLEAMKSLGISVSFSESASQHSPLESTLDTIDLSQVDRIAMSPGISPIDSAIAQFLHRAQDLKIPIWGELDFFTAALHALKVHNHYQPQVVAITGTNGKTTTTALCGVIFAKAEKSVAVAGNISPSLMDKLSTCLSAQQLPDIWVLELSSYQLFYSQDFNPDAACVLNLSEDHLDWHGDMQHYWRAKQKIFGSQTKAVVNRDDSAVMAMLTDLKKPSLRKITFGAHPPVEHDQFGIVGDMQGGIDWLAWITPQETTEFGKRRRNKNVMAEDTMTQVQRLIPAQALHIKGRHNATNALAALGLAQAIGLNMAVMLHGLRDYRGEPHRVQAIAVIDAVEYIDDSKGTNVGATNAALLGLGDRSGDKKIILIAGGVGKGQDFSALREAIHAVVKQVFLIGKDAQQIAAVIDHNIVAVTHVNSLEDAVTQAARLAQGGDKVLLSPACASFDMFNDYVHRAEVFASAVQELTYQTQKSGEVL